MNFGKIRVQFLTLVMLPAVCHSQNELSWDASVVDDVSVLGWSQEPLHEVGEFSESISTAAMMIVTRDQTVMVSGDISQPYIIRSIRKSFLSALLGIAIGRGQVDSTNTLADLDIGDNEPLTPIEQTATVRQLMQARSGVYHPAVSETAEMKAVRPSRGSHEPDTFWYYNNWDFNALGTIYTTVTGEKIGDAFHHEIAEKIGMEDFKLTDIKYDLEEEVSRHAALQRAPRFTPEPVSPEQKAATV